jgi:hypothetical protein
MRLGATMQQEKNSAKSPKSGSGGDKSVEDFHDRVVKLHVKTNKLALLMVGAVLVLLVVLLYFGGNSPHHLTACSAG